MKKRLVTLVALVIAAGTLACYSQVKREGRWTLGFTHRGFQSVLAPGREGPIAHFYVPYTVTNTTEDVMVVRLNGQLITETEQTVMAAPAPAAAFEICKQMKREMKDIDSMSVEEIPAGESREGLLIWKGVDDRARDLEVHIYGLSNEYRYDDPDNRTGYRRKAYRLKLHRPGDEHNRHLDSAKVVEEGWVWVPVDVR